MVKYGIEKFNGINLNDANFFYAICEVTNLARGVVPILIVLLVQLAVKNPNFKIFDKLFTLSPENFDQRHTAIIKSLMNVNHSERTNSISIQKVYEQMPSYDEIKNNPDLLVRAGFVFVNTLQFFNLKGAFDIVPSYFWSLLQNVDFEKLIASHPDATIQEFQIPGVFDKCFENDPNLVFELAKNEIGIDRLYPFLVDVYTDMYFLGNVRFMLEVFNTLRNMLRENSLVDTAGILQREFGEKSNTAGGIKVTWK